MQETSELIWIDLLMAQIICKSHLKTMNIYNNPNKAFWVVYSYQSQNKLTSWQHAHALPSISYISMSWIEEKWGFTQIMSKT